MRLSDLKKIDLPKILDDRGNLSFFENQSHIPFNIERVYWIYDVPGGELRGGHAFKNQQEFVIALSGSFDIIIDDGTEKIKITLNRSYHGIYVPKMIWRHLDNFSTNALAFIATDRNYDPEEYIRDYENYNQLISG